MTYGHKTRQADSQQLDKRTVKRTKCNNLSQHLKCQAVSLVSKEGQWLKKESLRKISILTNAKKEVIAIVVMLHLLIFSLKKTPDSYIVMEMKAEGRKFYMCIKGNLNYTGYKYLGKMLLLHMQNIVSGPWRNSITHSSSLWRWFCSYY